MSAVLRVWLHGEHVADVIRADQRLRLRYVGDGPDISTSMSAIELEHPHRRVAPWLEGLLPENEQVLQRWAREFQVAPTAFALLGSPVGLDCAGAVQFTSGDEPLPTARESGVSWLDDDALAALGDQLARDRAGWAVMGEAGRFSLAGVQDKVALRFVDGRYGVPYGDAATNVIVKPSLPGYEDHAVNEHVCLDAARRLGLDAVTSRVELFGEHLVFVTDRYDRRRNGARLERVHQEDLCQALGVPPSRKYQSDGGPTPRDVVEQLRRVSPPAQAERDARAFLDALLFNWLSVGTDAHAKNYSLLLPEDAPVQLAPLYDVASMAPYEDPLGCKLAMKFGGEYRIKAVAAQRNVAKAAAELGLDPDWALARAEDLAGGLVDALSDAVDAAGLRDRPVAVRLIDGVARHVGRHFGS